MVEIFLHHSGPILSHDSTSVYIFIVFVFPRSFDLFLNSCPVQFFYVGCQFVSLTSMIDQCILIKQKISCFLYRSNITYLHSKMKKKP